MNMAYYPGCSLQGTARDYDQSIKEICEKLAINLKELPDWNCCGASSAHMTNHEISMRLSIRNLLMVKDNDLDILVPCAACYQRLKAADKALRQDPHFWDVDSYAPDYEIIHISSFFSRPDILEMLEKHMVHSIDNMKVACYYGCLSLRPPHVTDSKNHEMPTTLEQITQSTGAQPVSWSHRTECCSGSLTMTRPDIAAKLVGDIVEAAQRGGATAMVTDCPMCQANVESRQLDINPAGPLLPVYYITELINAALSGTYPEKQQKVHLVPADVLQKHLAQADTRREDLS